MDEKDPPDRYGVRRGVEHIPLRGQPGEVLGRIVQPPVRVVHDADESERDER
jgi:hypothetical protein